MVYLEDNQYCEYYYHKQLIGWCDILKPTNEINSVDYMIWNVYITGENNRNRGHGTRMIRQAIKKCGRKKVYGLYVRKDNLAAIKVYTNNKFSIVREALISNEAVYFMKRGNK